MKYLIFLVIIERRCPLSLTEHCDYKYQLEDMIRPSSINEEMSILKQSKKSLRVS